MLPGVTPVCAGFGPAWRNEMDEARSLADVSGSGGAPSGVGDAVGVAVAVLVDVAVAVDVAVEVDVAVPVAVAVDVEVDVGVVGSPPRASGDEPRYGTLSGSPSSSAPRERG